MEKTAFHLQGNNNILMALAFLMERRYCYEVSYPGHQSGVVVMVEEASEAVPLLKLHARAWWTDAEAR